jgi:replicative superfamily II helicase
VQERHADWSARFGPLGLSVVELSGDSGGEARELEGADLICTTPEKFGASPVGLEALAVWGGAAG